MDLRGERERRVAVRAPGADDSTPSSRATVDVSPQGSGHALRWRSSNARDAGIARQVSVSRGYLPASPMHATCGAAADGVVTEYGVAWTRMLEVRMHDLFPMWPLGKGGAGAVIRCVVRLMGCARPSTEREVVHTHPSQAAADELERGDRWWACAVREHGVTVEQAVAHVRACSYLAGLAAIYAAATLVREAAQRLHLLHIVADVRRNWERCLRAWDGGPADVGGAARSCAVELGVGGSGGVDAASAACTASPAPLAVAATAAAASADETHAWSMLEALPQLAARLDACAAESMPWALEWGPGLDGLCLLPLGALPEGEHAVGWQSGRSTLPVLANLWLHHVSPACPELD